MQRWVDGDIEKQRISYRNTETKMERQRDIDLER